MAERSRAGDDWKGGLCVDLSGAAVAGEGPRESRGACLEEGGIGRHGDDVGQQISSWFDLRDVGIQTGTRAGYLALPYGSSKTLEPARSTDF